MGEVINVDFESYTADQVAKVFTGILENVARSRGYDPATAARIGSIMVDAIGRMRNYSTKVELPPDVPPEQAQRIAQGVASNVVHHCLSEFASIVPELCYPEKR